MLVTTRILRAPGHKKPRCSGVTEDMGVGGTTFSAGWKGTLPLEVRNQNLAVTAAWGLLGRVGQFDPIDMEAVEEGADARGLICLLCSPGFNFFVHGWSRSGTAPQTEIDTPERRIRVVFAH